MHSNQGDIIRMRVGLCMYYSLSNIRLIFYVWDQLVSVL